MSSSVEPGKTYKVLQAYNASTPGELTVKRFDLVFATVDQDRPGYVHCTRFGDPNAKGYVPISVVADISEAHALDGKSDGRANGSSSDLGTTFHRTLSGGEIARESSESSGDADGFTAIVQQFRQRLDNVLKDRDQAYERLESAVQMTQKELDQCVERNSSLTQKILELDQWLEDERRRWNDLLEDERRQIDRKTALRAVPSSASK